MNITPLISVSEITQSCPQIYYKNEIVLLWQVFGYCQIQLGQSLDRISQNDLFIISPLSVYSIPEQTGKSVLFHLDIEQYQGLQSADSPLFCTRPTDRRIEDSLKTILSEIYYIYHHQLDFQQPLLYSKSYQLIYELYQKLHTEKDSAFQKSGDKLHEIVSYLNHHYSEKISLSELSRQFFLSPNYLSAYFHKNMSMTISEYLNSLRLNFAYYQLIHTSDTIEAISYANGFSSIHSFAKLFSAVYGTGPSQYRKNFPSISLAETTGEDCILNYYHSHSNSSSIADIPVSQVQIVKSVDISAQGFKNRHPFLSILNTADAAQLLQANVQKTLIQTLKDIHFETIYISRLLNEDMSIYHLDIQGQPFLNFRNLDLLCDFIVSLGVNPVIELSFMPKSMAKEIKLSSFVKMDIISLPKNYQNWNFMIQGILLHLSARYGLRILNTFKFCVWATPDIELSPYYLSSKEYFELYYNTWKSIKSISETVSVGLPKMAYSSLEKNTWFTEFISYCEENTCIPDFIGWNFYAMEETSREKAIREKKYPEASLSETALEASIEKIQSRFKAKKWSFKQYYIPEWNFSFSTNCLNDSIFRAVYIVRNALKNMNGSTLLGCSDLTDYSAVPLQKAEDFYGWFGIHTAMGIPKSSYYAYQMLSQMGRQVLDHGDGYCVTTSNQEIQIMLYHYLHFHTTPSSNLSLFSDYYSYFDMNKKLNIQLTLEQLSHTSYSCFITAINRESGSAYDYWIKMGHPPINSLEIAEYISKHSAPDVSSTYLNVPEQTLVINETLLPLEIKLIVLRPI